MVFLTLANLGKRTASQKWYRAQMYLRFSQRFRDRKRNCYSLAVRYVHKALKYSYLWGRLRRNNMQLLWEQRIEAAAGEHGMEIKPFMEGLVRCHIHLDRKVLSELAVYEPRTFQSLVEIAKKKSEQEGFNSMETPKAQGIVTRGML